MHATIGFSFIVNADNAGAIAEFCALAKRIGAHHVKLSACVVSNDAAENNTYHAPLADVVSANIAAARLLESDDFHILDHYHALPERFERPYTACPMLEYITIIGADCTVYTCQDKAYTVAGTLGSFNDRRFRDFWYSDENAARVRGWTPSSRASTTARRFGALGKAPRITRIDGLGAFTLSVNLRRVEFEAGQFREGENLGA